MTLPAPLQWLVYQQDYLWFLSLAGWTLVLAAWWRIGRPTGFMVWLPVAATLGIVSTLITFSQLIAVVSRRPHEEPWRVWDFLQGDVHALLAAGILWVACAQRPRGRILGGGFALTLILVALIRWWYPFLGAAGIALGLGAACLAAGRLPEQGSRTTIKLALGFVFLSALTSGSGILADLADQPTRLFEITGFGLGSAVFQIAAVATIAIALFKHDSSEANLDLPWLARALGLWICVGLILAAVIGYWARAAFERELLARARMGAALIEPHALETAFGPRFHVDEKVPLRQGPPRLVLYRAKERSLSALRPVSQSLARVEESDPEAYWAIVLTLRDGWLVNACVSTRMPDSLQEYGLYGQVTDSVWKAWYTHEASVVGPTDFFYGAVLQARAPILSATGKIRGWLAIDYGIVHWLRAQIQARVLAYFVVAMGGVLLVLGERQRYRSRAQEAARLEAAAARATSQQKTAFLAKVSHELRTPIQSLLGYSDLLHRHIAHDAKAASWLSSLQQHGELMTRLVNDLIDLSAVESGSFQLSPKVVPVGAVVQQTIESFRPRAEKLGLSLACFVDPSTPAAALLDGERFRQVLTNLVGNALKFTDRGGVTVAIHAHPVGEQQEIQLVVRDTGPGIPPAQQHRLFTAFSRLEATAAKEGSGLGLALSAALCRTMGGDLTVESDGVTGSAFAASFRAKPAELFETRPALAPGTSLRGRHILVVDDNRLLRELFVAFLTEQGALCAAATTGKQAVAQAAVERFDAVILDLALPDGDSTAIVTPLRVALPPGARIVGVSAHAGAADRARVLAAGMDAFLSKPVALDALATAVSAAPTEPAATITTPESLFERLRTEFRRDANDQRRQLADTIAAENWALVQSQAHYLKNSAAVLRDDVLYETCTGLEQAALDADGGAVRAWWARCSARLEVWQESSSSISPAP